MTSTVRSQKNIATQTRLLLILSKQVFWTLAYTLFFTLVKEIFLTPHIYRKKNILQKKKKSSYVRFESSKQLSFFLSRITSHLTHLTYQSIFSSIVFSLRTLLMCCFAKLREYKIVQVVLDLVKNLR